MSGTHSKCYSLREGLNHRGGVWYKRSEQNWGAKGGNPQTKGSWEREKMNEGGNGASGVIPVS